jgi:predicted ribosome quality control (RQC) complex YloA/Tae2 family protein
VDAFVLKRVVSELDSTLSGALVSKVHQPGEREIYLLFWTGRGEARLLLSADPDHCRIHLSTRKAVNPPAPPRFCQFLRAHLEGMRLASATVAPFDRHVRLDFSSPREDAPHRAAVLHAELFGRHANLLFVDEAGTILSALRPVSPEESRIRPVAAGIPYAPLPPPERPFLPDFGEEDAAEAFADRWEGLGRALLRRVSGIGPDLAKEIASRGEESPGALLAAARETARRYAEDDLPVCIGTLPDGKGRLLPFPCPGAGFVGHRPFPPQGGDGERPGGPANRAADEFYAAVAEARDVSVLRQRAVSRLHALLKKERGTLEKVEGDVARLSEGLKGRERGEILKGALPLLSKGMTAWEGVPLDPAKTPLENMELHFRRYKRAKGAVEVVAARRREVADSVYHLESVELLLEEARGKEEYLEILRELAEAHPARGKGAEGAGKGAAGRRERSASGRGGAPGKGSPGKGGKGKGGGEKGRSGRREEAPWHSGGAGGAGGGQGAPSSQGVERVAFGGYTILVGKNNGGNDRIVKDLSAPSDLWLHAQEIPGSHVLVKVQPGREVPREVIEEAARIAVLRSKAKGSSNVPVYFAEARHVSKFKGAKPGLVRVEKFTTVLVR